MLSDVRFALRSLLKTPGFTAAAILILTLGIGANTAVFSVVEAVLLRPLPYARPEQLVSLGSAESGQVGLFNVLEYCAYRDNARSFTGLVAATGFNTTWMDHGDATLAQGLRLSAATFDLFGVRPVVGRLLRPDDDAPDAAGVVVISEALWRSAYGGQPEAVGRTVIVDGAPRTIVGVYPANFLLPLNGFHNDLCVPLQPDAIPVRHNPAALHYLRVYGRLKPGVTLAAATAETGAVVAQLRRTYPNDFVGTPTNPLTPLAAEIIGDTRPVLLTLLGVVGSLLLLASANLAGLLLVRGLGRQRELAIRAALGSSKRQLMRLLLAESAVLAVVGGVLGVLLAQWSLDALLALIPAELPRAHEVQFNPTVLAFTVGVSLAAGLLPGLAPLWMVSRLDLRESVNLGGRGNTAGGAQLRLRHLLASIQIALALGLLACTALFLRSFWAVDQQLPAGDPGHVITARLTLPATGYPDAAALQRYADTLLPRLQAIPGVTQAGATSLLPLATGLATTDFAVTGQPRPADATYPQANYRLVTPDYFPAMGTALRAGRLFTPTDDVGHPLVILVSQALAQAYFPRQDALGQRLDINDGPNGFRTAQIVGVVADVKQQKMEDAPSYDVYVPFRQMSAVAVPWVRLRSYWVLRTAAAPAAVEAAVRQEVRRLDPSVPVGAVATMAQVVDAALAVRRFTLIIIGFLASVALVLTTAGVYATIAYGVAQRTREIGVRLALGATTEAIFAMVVREGLYVAFAGAALGLVVAVAVAQLITSQLYGVGPRDPAALGLALLVLVAIAAAACALPARRAARVNPLEAMRTE